MAWRVEIARRADKQLAGIDAVARARILRLLQRVAASEDPCSLGEALVGGLAGLWRYRVGDYRVIARIEDAILTVYVIEAGHRREVYR